MASRRFKFKPKPVISAVVRRPKDNLDVDKEGNLDQVNDNDCSDVLFSTESIEKESLATSIKNEIILKDNSKILEDVPNEKFYEENSEERIKANVIQPVLSSSQNLNISIDYIVAERTTSTDTQIYQESAVHEVVESIITTDTQLIQNSSRLQAESEKKCQSGDEIKKITDVRAVPKNIVSQSKSTVTGNVNSVSENNVLNITAEVPKVVSKFGRYRHKPVLSSAVLRPKVEVSIENTSVDNAKTLDNCDGLEKSKQSITLVNNVDIVLEPQKVNSSNNQSDCDILSNEISVFSDNISKPSSNDLSKPPQSPVKSVHKAFAFRPVPKLSDGVRRPSLQAIENEEDNNQKKEIKDNFKNYNDLVAEGKLFASKKEQSFSKNKRQPRSQLSTFARMGQDAMDKLKTKFGDHCPAKNEMTMLDLIFYNPKSNPMTQTPVVSLTNLKRKLDLDSKESNGLMDEMLAEQSVDDVEESSNLAMPVPQLKVGPDGQVILDPQSLIIETTDARKNRENLENSEIVQETEGSYGSYVKKRTKRNEWSPEETLQFYRALNTLGTDFALMASLFPKRTRRDLKMKFKREERVNLHLIDKAVAQPMEFDFKALEEEMKIEADLVALKFAEKERVKKEVKEAKMKLKREREIAPPKRRRLHTSHTFREFTEEDIGEFRTTRNQIKKKAKRKKIVEKNKESKENCENSSDDDKGRIEHILTDTRAGRSKNDVKTEIEVENETNKRQMNSSIIEENSKTRNEEDDHLNEDGTVPGLFEEPWDLTVQPIPDIEANILAGSQEENASVSMISDLGSSFVEEINNMESSTEDFLTTVDRFTEQLEHRVLPPYDSITKHKASKENLQTNSSLLNTRLLTESMEIIDQLTSNVGDDNNEMVYIENEGNEDVNVDDLTQKPVQSSAVLADEPILITLVPSEGCNETYNVEIQMPFKIRQKQMNLAKRIQSNNQDENNSCGEIQSSQRSSNVALCVSKSKDIDQRYSNSEEVEQIKETNSIVFGFDKSDPISTRSEDEICNSIDSVCHNISKDDNNSTSNYHTSEELNPMKSFVLGADGVLRSDNLSMFIPQFEIITADCSDNNVSQETNLCPPSELVGSDNYIILESIETNTTPSIVYSSHMPDDTECILGD